MRESLRPLKIAEIAPVGSAVRRGVGESVEHLVAVMCDELGRRGHDVTLFATGDSESSANLRWLFERGYELDQEAWDWQFIEYMHAGYAYESAHQFDVIHCHSYHFGVPFTQYVDTPNVHTHHVEVDPLVLTQYKRLPQVQIVAISEHQARSFDGHPRVELIPHGIETDAFPFAERPGDYLVFVGRMIKDKGPIEAIEIARAVGMPIVLAGPLDEEFQEQIEPWFEGDGVTYVGRVEPAERDRLLVGAAALLYPLLYPEPFGLVPIEAMACGTPVVGVGIGAVPELVEPGITGYLADSWEGLAALIPRAIELDRAAVRARARERFDYQRMIDKHEELYLRLAVEARS